MSATFAFAHAGFHIVDRTALFWPEQSAMIVADLHLEKASWFAVRGQMLPPYDSQATLERLARAMSATGASRVWCLGDNFHDSDGPSRLQPKARALLASLTSTVAWHWITGNHDEHLPEGIGGAIHDEAEFGGLILRHEADPLDLRPELSGHFHPKIRAAARGRGVTRPCFVRGVSKLILPSFGAFTGGMDARDPVISALVGRERAAVIEAGGKALVLPL